MNDIKISNLQLFVVVSMFLSGGSMLILPSIAAAEAGVDAWISVIVSIGIGLLLIPLYVSLNAKFPNQSFIQYSGLILGKIGGVIVSLLFLASTFFLSAILLWNIGTLASIQIMPETPLLPIMILMLAIVVMGAWLGLETVARTGEILIPWAIILFVIPIVFVTPKVDLESILPVLNDGFKPVMRSTYTVTAVMFVEGYVLLMVLPYVSERKGIMRTFLIGGFLSGLVLLVTIFYCITILGERATAGLVFPTYTLAKLISIGHFVERIEAIIASIWVITIYYKATVCLYVTAFGTAQLFKLNDYRPLVVPLGLILLPLATIIYPDMIYFRLVSAKYYPLVDYTIGLFVPLLMWVVYHIRKKNINEQLRTLPK